MLPLHVALVPYQEGLVDSNELLRVAAALQTQVVRDFTPLWGIPATVSAFLSLDDVPPGTLPLVIVPNGSLLAREHGFHITVHGNPIGLIEAVDGWSRLASHELLEMLADPQGKRTVVGPSLADADPGDAVPDGAVRQGAVEYLVEICDPCEDEAYDINGYEVSDFVTPQYYYAPDTASGQVYSFAGTVTQPREVLDGGYITWHTELPESAIWQAKRDSAGLTVGPLILRTPSFAREWVDYVSDIFDPGMRSFESATTIAVETPPSTTPYGDRVRKHVARILEETYVSSAEVPIESVIEELDKAVKDYPAFEQDQSSSLSALGLPPTIYDGHGVPSQAQLEAVLRKLEQLRDRQPAGQGAPRGLSRKVTAMCMQGST